MVLFFVKVLNCKISNMSNAEFRDESELVLGCKVVVKFQKLKLFLVFVRINAEMLVVYLNYITSISCAVGRNGKKIEK